MDKKLKNKVISWVILLVLVLIWGSSFILIKKGLETYSSTEVGALRTIISFLFLLPFALTRLSRVKKSEWKYLAMVGIIGSGAPAFLFAKAQTGIDSNLAGILNSLTPLFTLIIGLMAFGLKTRWFNVTGVFLGLIGATGLLAVSGGQAFEVNFGYAFYIIVATICYALNVNIVKTHLQRIDATTITSMSFLVIGIPLIIYLLLFTDFSSQLQNDANAFEGLGYITILAVFGTGLALIAFNYLIKISSVIFAASVTYLIPIVAVMWGILDGEVFELIYLAWILLILIGVFFVNLNYQNKFFTKIDSYFFRGKK